MEFKRETNLKIDEQKTFSTSNGVRQLVIFLLDGEKYALSLEVVKTVLPMVEMRPVPKAPEIIFGLINVRGEVVPVVNIRKRFALPVREEHLSDHIIIAQTSRRKIGLVVDSVVGVVDQPSKDIIEAGIILRNIVYIDGVVKMENGLILIHDLETFLSLEEEDSLTAALQDLA